MGKHKQDDVSESSLALSEFRKVQTAFEILERIKPDIEELWHLLYLFDGEKDFYNAIVDLYVHDYRAEQCLIERAEKLKELIQIDSKTNTN